MPTLYDHSSPPPGAQFLDGSPGIKVCETYTFEEPAGVGVAGQVTEVWFYVGGNNGGTWTVVGWDITTNDVGSGGGGTLVANQAFVGTPTANAWNKVTLTAPVDIPANANKRWRFGVHNPQYYWASNDFFLAHDEVSGPISALRDGDTTSTLGLINQGTFGIGSSVTAYPAQTGSKARYGIDVTFVPSGGEPPEEHTTAGSAVATATATATAAKRGISAGSATAAAGATAAVTSTRVTSGTAGALAGATATTATARTTSGSAVALAGARATAAKRAVTAGTARATATGGSYSAQGAPGPWLTKRNRDRRIVTRVQVAN